MKRERIDKALQFTAQIVVAERNLAAAEAKVRHWALRLDKLRGEQLALRLENQRPLGRYTQKSKRKHVTWYVVRDILTQPEHRRGLTTGELFRIARHDLGKLNRITFRAYLREFYSPERGLLKREGDRWHLNDIVISQKPHLRS